MATYTQLSNVPVQACHSTTPLLPPKSPSAIPIARFTISFTTGEPQATAPVAMVARGQLLQGVVLFTLRATFGVYPYITKSTCKVIIHPTECPGHLSQPLSPLQ
jgi:hypothetical protein